MSTAEREEQSQNTTGDKALLDAKANAFQAIEKGNHILASMERQEEQLTQVRKK